MNRCLARMDGTQCDRFTDHEGPHVAFTLTGATVAWNDPVICKNCGEFIHQSPDDYLRRWFHVDFNEPSCRLAAAP